MLYNVDKFYIFDCLKERVCVYVYVDTLVVMLVPYLVKVGKVFFGGRLNIY